MNKILNVIREIFSAKSGQLSSKRVMGVLILSTVLYVYVNSANNQVLMPEYTDVLCIIGSSLLGIDSVTSAFKKE